MALTLRKKPVPPAVDPLDAAKLQADSALSLFRSTLFQVESANKQLSDVEDDAKAQIAALQARHADASAARNENEKVVANLRKILG